MYGACLKYFMRKACQFCLNNYTLDSIICKIEFQIYKYPCVGCGLVELAFNLIVHDVKKNRIKQLCSTDNICLLLF